MVLITMQIACHRAIDEYNDEWNAEWVLEWLLNLLTNLLITSSTYSPTYSSSLLSFFPNLPSPCSVTDVAGINLVIIAVVIVTEKNFECPVHPGKYNTVKYIQQSQELNWRKASKTVQVDQA